MPTNASTTSTVSSTSVPNKPRITTSIVLKKDFFFAATFAHLYESRCDDFERGWARLSTKEQLLVDAAMRLQVHVKLKMQALRDSFTTDSAKRIVDAIVTNAGEYSLAYADHAHPARSSSCAFSGYPFGESDGSPEYVIAKFGDESFDVHRYAVVPLNRVYAFAHVLRKLVQHPETRRNLDDAWRVFQEDEAQVDEFIYGG